MKLLFGCFTAVFMLLLYGNANAQNKINGVQGRLSLNDNILANTATILLVRLRDSSVIGNAVINKDGSFSFHDILSDTYLIKVNSNNYQHYTTAPFSVSNKLVTLPVINLLPLVTALKDITIIDKKAYIETRPDKTILNVEKGIVVSGITVLDILGSAPGVKLSSNNQILLRGGQRASIAVNGRLLNLSAQDAAEQLQNMSSVNISQIEIITNPSGRYDAVGAGGVINIILKKGNSEGFNGSVTEGLGYGNFSKVNTNLALNFRAKSLNFFGNYSFGENNTDHVILTDRYVGTATEFNVNYYNKQKTYASNYNLGADYDIDNAHTLGFLVIGSFNNNFLNKNVISLMSNNGVVDSILNTLSVLNRHVNTVNYNINYTGKLNHTDQTLSADADFSTYKRVSAEDINSSVYNTQTSSKSGTQYFRNEAPTHVNIYSGKVDYVDPISKTRRLEAGLKSVYAKSDNVQRFNSIIGEAYYPNLLISSQFEYKENISSAYVNYIATPSSKFNYQLDLRVEHVESDANMGDNKFIVSRSYTNLFPAIMFNYTPNTNNSFLLNYSRRMDRPNYQDLNPLISFQDKYNFTMGNAYLKPSYADKIQLSHTYKGKFVTALYASLVSDFYDFTYFIQNDLTKVFATTKTNLKHANTYGINFSGPVEVCNWWNLHYDVDVSYQHYVDYAGKLNQNTADAIFKLNQQFALPANIAMSLDAQYEIPTYYAIYHYKASYNVRPAISKKIFQKKGTISFAVKDVFNTTRDRFSTNYYNLNVMGYDKKETRVYSLSFAYRFGKSTLKASRKHETGSNDDLKRVTGVN